MNKDTIKKIQKQIIQLLPAEQRDQPGILLTDSCSEVSRLVAGWIKMLDTSNHIMIWKGANVCGTQKAHDILVIEASDNKIYVIDPTIWQFFPQEKSILVFISDNMCNALREINAKYGGQWSESEEFVYFDKDEEKEYLNIIFENIRENLG